jgi:hypothetical protein
MHCSSCSQILDANTPAGMKDAKPEPGSISVCFYCAQICVFNNDMTLRNITQEELESLPFWVKWAIFDAVKAIKERINQN